MDGSFLHGVRISDQITQTFVEENRRSFVNQSRAPTDVRHFILAEFGVRRSTIEVLILIPSAATGDNLKSKNVFIAASSPPWRPRRQNPLGRRPRSGPRINHYRDITREFLKDDSYNLAWRPSPRKLDGGRTLTTFDAVKRSNHGG
jgi:hypothetical protein